MNLVILDRLPPSRGIAPGWWSPGFALTFGLGMARYGQTVRVNIWCAPFCITQRLAPMLSWFSRSKFQTTAEAVDDEASQSPVDYKFSTIADKNAVIFAYLYLLNREPESDAAVQGALDAHRTIRQLKNDTYLSEEFKNMNKTQLFSLAVDQYLRCKSERISDHYHESPSANDVLVLQTSDANRYKKLLSVSSKYNKIYSTRQRLLYKEFYGIKRGEYSHHAMYNRMHLLKEIADSNFTGWVFYIDADAIFRKPDFDLKNHLTILREQKKCMSLHTVYQPHEAQYRWWDVNDGCFAIDLASERARCVIDAWAGIFTDLYSTDDYKMSNTWSDNFILDDQNALWHVLRHFEMEPHVDLTDIQGDGGYTQQFLRSNSTSISSDIDMESRMSRLMDFGRSIYGE